MSPSVCFRASLLSVRVRRRNAAVLKCIWNKHKKNWVGLRRDALWLALFAHISWEKDKRDSCSLSEYDTCILSKELQCYWLKGTKERWGPKHMLNIWLCGIISFTIYNFWTTYGSIRNTDICCRPWKVPLILALKSFGCHTRFWSSHHLNWGDDKTTLGSPPYSK